MAKGNNLLGFGEEGSDLLAACGILIEKPRCISGSHGEVDWPFRSWGRIRNGQSLYPIDIRSRGSYGVDGDFRYTLFVHVTL